MSESFYSWELEGNLAEVLVGRKVVKAERGDPRKEYATSTEEISDGVLTLDNGVRLIVSAAEYDCCSSAYLTGVAATDNVITAVEFDHGGYSSENYNDDGDTQHCAIKVITDGGPVNIVTSDTNPSNGYYLNGFSLNVTVIR